MLDPRTGKICCRNWSWWNLSSPTPTWSSCWDASQRQVPLTTSTGANTRSHGMRSTYSYTTGIFLCRTAYGCDRVCPVWRLAGIPEKEPGAERHILQEPGCEAQNKPDVTAARALRVADRRWDELSCLRKGNGQLQKWRRRDLHGTLPRYTLMFSLSELSNLPGDPSRLGRQERVGGGGGAMQSDGFRYGARCSPRRHLHQDRQGEYYATGCYELTGADRQPWYALRIEYWCWSVFHLHLVTPYPFKGRLPVKWTAYESLLYGMYTTQSDV